VVIRKKGESGQKKHVDTTNYVKNMFF
jgi:hypothetical protein